MKSLLFGFLVLFSFNTYSSETPLDKQLEELNMPSNQLPGAVSEEKLYSVQLRHTPLTKKHEISLSGAKDFRSDGYLNSNQVGLGYRYHLDDKWSVKANYVRVFNELNESGQVLLQEEKLLSDADYLISQFDVGAEYNLFYGKFRFNMEKVFYFDQYVGLSAGVIELRRGVKPVVSFDAGIAFWAGNKMDLRIGLKNNVFAETNGLGEESYTRNMVGYLSVGYLLGGK